MRILKTEVLIIGSGFGAAAPALRFSDKGFKVLMLEKGKNIIPEKDFRMTQDPKYFLKYLKGAGSNNIEFTFAEALGGGSGFYEMVSLRAPSKVFSLRSEDGRNYWPAGINRSTLEPYYDIAEEMLHVEQIAKDEIPKSGVVFSNLMKNLGYSCDRAPYAVEGCVGSGYCISGCIFGAKQSLHMNYLPMAEKLGTQILTETEALEIRTLISDVNSTKRHLTMNGLPYRYEVKCRDKKNDEIFKIHAKLIILAGGTVGSAKLLLNSKKNLHFLSCHVGKNIAFNGSAKIAGLLPEGMIEGDLFSGRSHPGMISYQFFNSLGITISSAKPLPITIFSSARLVLEGEKREPAYWGKANVELVKKLRRRMIVLYALGLTPPGAEIRLTQSGTVESFLKLNSVYKNYYKNTSNLLKSIFKKNGCKIIELSMVDQEGKPKTGISFSTTHMTGSCRMADNKNNGVVDAFGEVFDYPGIFVTDGAAIPTSLAVNSSLTILANAERIAHHLVDKFTANRKDKMNILHDISLNNNY